MARELKVTCRQCGGSGWFVPERYGCFNCGGYKKHKGSGVDKDSVMLLVKDEVFNKWVPIDEAVKEVCAFTGWTTKSVKNLLNRKMHQRYHMFAFQDGKVIAKQYHPDAAKYSQQ